eukprot:579400-Pyramimonas_sp.AAC.2
MLSLKLSLICNKNKFKEHSRNIQGTFKAHSRNFELRKSGLKRSSICSQNETVAAADSMRIIQGSFKEHSRNIYHLEGLGLARLLDARHRLQRGRAMRVRTDLTGQPWVLECVVHVHPLHRVLLQQLRKYARAFTEHSRNIQGTFSIT